MPYSRTVDVERLPLEGSVLIRPRVFEDARGSFMELYSMPRYRELGIEGEFTQGNLSRSKKGVLRGLHAAPGMAKLVQVIAGEAFDVIVDFRLESPTYLKWYGTTLNAARVEQLYVPSGFLHGFLALSDDVVFLYMQTATYDPTQEFGIAWNDPDIAVAWPLADREPILSAKDARHPFVAGTAAQR